MQPGTYEQDILQEQVRRCGSTKGMGIFGCDHYDVFSVEQTELGECNGRMLRSIEFPSAPINTSVHGTVANALVFSNMWQKVKDHGRFLVADWTEGGSRH